MPMVELDYNDLAFLISKYEERQKNLNETLCKLNFINTAIIQLTSNVGEDMLKDKEYVSQYNVLADLRDTDAELDEIKHKVEYFMRIVKESMKGTNVSEERIEDFCKCKESDV